MADNIVSNSSKTHLGKFYVRLFYDGTLNTLKCFENSKLL